MRTQLFSAIKSALEAGGQIAFVGFWNENVYYIEQEQPFALPAVFIEFNTIDWQRIKNDTLRCRSRVRLHILTAYHQPFDIDTAFGLSESVQRTVERIEPNEHFGNIQLVESVTNHSFEDLLETIDSYNYTGVRFMTEPETTEPGAADIEPAPEPDPDEPPSAADFEHGPVFDA